MLVWDNETRARLWVKNDYLPDARPNQLPDVNKYLDYGAAEETTKLARRQLQFQQHLPPHIPATISWFPDSVHEATQEASSLN